MASVLTESYFHDEAAAIGALEGILWPEGPICPHCGAVERIGKLEGVKDKRGRVRLGLWKCYNCRGQFTVRKGTIFEDSKVPLHLWFQAAYLMCASKKGISSNQLHRTLGVTLKTAWFMSHRLREAMRELHLSPMGGKGRTVEADETFIGGKEKNRHATKRAKTRLGGSWGKETVFSLVERKSGVRSTHTPSVSATTLRPILIEQLQDATKLVTDDAGQYRHMHRDFDHEVVNHGAGEYVRGDAHTNTVESYFAVLKRGITGIYHHVSPQHLKRYLAEFDFRYNHRAALGIADGARTVAAMRGARGKRLMYRDSLGR